MIEQDIDNTLNILFWCLFRCNQFPENAFLAVIMRATPTRNHPFFITIGVRVVSVEDMFDMTIIMTPASESTRHILHIRLRIGFYWLT